jgi:RluA family pseudouridine synthase
MLGIEPSMTIFVQVIAVLDIRYIDNHLLVLNKPAGVLVQGDRTGDLDLHTAAKEEIGRRFSKPGGVYLGLVHRLDRPTSGLLVFARTSKAASRLSQAFRNRTIEKRYLAIVEGITADHDHLVDWLVRKRKRVKVCSENEPDAQFAELSFRTIETAGEHSLVEITLMTGRKHQIRVQFAARGHPVVGDFRYGSRQTFDGRNLALHASVLKLKHPVRRVDMTWACEPPESWRGRFDDAVSKLGLDSVQEG